MSEGTIKFEYAEHTMAVLDTDNNIGELIYEGEMVGKLKRNNIIKIGRDDSNDLIFNDNYISREHCYIQTDENEIFMIDNNSTNGTYINNKKIQAKGMKLHNKDIIQIGKIKITVIIFQGK